MAEILVRFYREACVIFIICCGLLITFIILSRWRPRPRKDVPTPAELPIDILHADSNAIIDIVAVHGLAANPDYAWVWQPKNNPPGRPEYPAKHFNWLRHLLPEELSSKQLPCRVMTFNYLSTWFLDAPQVRSSSISNNLLASLRDKREKAPHRPLIFIGHSFGGNLIEQAIVSASQQSSNREVSEIAKSTVGVLFLGTPQRGCTAATWGAMIASLSPSQFASESRILEELEMQSGTLTDRLHEFSRWLFVESVPAVCCFEQLVTNLSSRVRVIGWMLPFRNLVVPENSACIDGHYKISLHTDHFKINKFYGPDDPSFKRIYPEIERMARSAQDLLKHRRNPKDIPMDQSETSGDLRACLQEMRVTNPQDILLDIQTQNGKRVEHTCEWILKREEFSAWGANNTSQLLHIIGSPGIGKTMMSTFIIEVLKEKVQKSPDKVIAYFLCDYRYEGRRTVTAMLRSLIWQLLLQRNGLFQHVRSDLEKHKDGRLFQYLFENFSSLWRIFENMLRDDQSGEVFILIDALDECEVSARQALLNCIRELFQVSPKSAGNFKFFVTCRPGIDDVKFELHGIGVELNMDSIQVKHDLSNYIDIKVEDLAQRKIYPQALKDVVKAALKSNAEGTFLWVSLMLSTLKSAENHEIKDKLKGFPRRLDEIYKKILDDNILKERQEDGRFLLLSMIAARRPLTKKELAASFAFWKTSLVVGDQDLQIYEEIWSLCSSIIEIDATSNDIARFCHKSVKDFLLGEHKGLSEEWYRTSEHAANLLMFKTCWGYLSSDKFNSGNLVISRKNNVLLKANMQELQPHLLRHPFLEYAANWWEYHATASDSDLLMDLTVNIEEYNLERTPELRDSWLLRTAKEGQYAVLHILIRNGADFNALDKDGRTPLSWAAARGHEIIVKMLLAINKVNMNSQDNDGRTPLWWAAANGHLNIIKSLVEKDEESSKICDFYKRSPLEVAAFKGREDSALQLLPISQKWMTPGDREKVLRDAAGKCLYHLAKELLKFGDLDVNASHDKAALHLATLASSPGTAVAPWSNNKGNDLVQLLLEKGAKIRLESTRESKTALHYAAEIGNTHLVQYFLKNGGSMNWVDVQDSRGWTPLHYAAENGHKDALISLLNRGADINKATDWPEHALELAARKGHLDCVQELLSNKANVNAKNRNLESALTLAAWNGHFRVVSKLLEADASWWETDRLQQTPLQLAEVNGHIETARIISKAESSRHKKEVIEEKTGHKLKSDFLVACKYANLDTIEELFEQSPRVLEARDKVGNTPLHYSAHLGQEKPVKFLCKQCKMVDSTNVFNMTALQVAATRGHAKMVQILVECEAASKTHGDGFMTNLHWAVLGGNHEVVKALLQIESDDMIHSVNQWRSTALHLAAENGNMEIVELLLERGARKDAQNRWYDTTMDLARKNNYLDVFKMLETWEYSDRKLPSGDNISLVEENSSLHIIACQGDIEAAEQAIRHLQGDDRTNALNRQNQRKETPLHMAARCGHNEMMIWLIDNGADVQAVSRDYTTVLHIASAYCEPFVLERLIRKEAMVNQGDYWRWTPLHHASRAGKADNVKRLINCGAVLDAMTDNGKTALHLAAENGKISVYGILIENDATQGYCDKSGLTERDLLQKYEDWNRN